MMISDVIEIADKRLLKLSVFAKTMGLHVRTIQLWAKEQGLPVIRVGNQMLIDLDDLPDWFEQHKIKLEA